MEATWTLPFPYLGLVDKFVVGGDGGSAGARISRPIIVIRLESKLINKIKATFFFLNNILVPFGTVWFGWFGFHDLVWFFALVFWNRMRN